MRSASCPRSWRWSERTTNITGLEVDAALELPESRADRLAPELETAVYRIVQEALANVAKHAGASTVRISLRELDDTLQVTVADDGAGFDPTRAEPGARAGRDAGARRAGRR